MWTPNGNWTFNLPDSALQQNADEPVRIDLRQKCIYLLSNSLNSFFMEMFRDQFGEFVSGYWDLKH